MDTKKSGKPSSRSTHEPENKSEDIIHKTDEELLDILLTVDGKGKKVKEEALQELISRKILTLNAD